MADNLEPNQGDKTAHGHEEKDINVLAVSKFTIGLTLGVIASLLVVAGLLNFLLKTDPERNAKPSAIALTNPQKEPPEPRLQSTPKIDIRQFRADEDAILNSYAWIDPDKGIVRIPVDRALDLVAKEGLPSRPVKGESK
jgi:hypothetical protein